MTIFYTASYYGKEKYQDYYDAVLASLQKTGAKIVSPELGNYKENINNFQSEARIHYEAIRKGILISDVVVIEISYQDFQLGHEATLAMLNKKPVLCLSINEDFSEKISNEYFFGAKYNKNNIDGVLSKFLSSVGIQYLNQRFNLFLSKKQLDYIKSHAKEMNMNSSEYIRKLINDDMY